ncbi:hypothetical protein RHS01_07098 [Rhizoctonia solani]|uniref:Uncharacterized protein n=1 Tax=Rhizoctonia solani TaxID=456999 RepID=A0A8H7IBN4_9AGAM|nr:hypothetical protein RHS01_07098 [Rhizoctonia solani]
MSSLFSLLGKLSRYLTGTRNPAVMNVEFKNRFIFPKNPLGAQYFDHGYVPWELLEAIQQDRDAVDGIGHIYVSSAKYCEPVASNSAMLGSALTSSHEPVARGMLSSDGASSISNSLIGVPALDMCRVSAHGGFKEMAARLALTPYSCIAELVFTDDSFTIEKLLNLAVTLSNYEPRYDLFKTQCYWYALMLWELVQRVSDKVATHSPPFVQGPIARSVAPSSDTRVRTPKRTR